MSAEQKMVTLTIDGAEITVPAGTLVIRAAEQVGTYIPRFCDHPLLDPLGACRQCLVEVEGQRKPLTACTTTVSDGMIVKTQFTSEVAADAQEGVLELLLINHPLDCPMCDKGGECPLQDQALAYGPGGSRYIDPKRRYTKPVPISPLVKLDRERCVLCARCTRFASQISGDPFIELFERGAMEQVGIYEDEPYDSVFSGNVIQICPVGALTSSTFRFKARPFDMTSVDSTCNRCASGCSIEVQERRGEIARVLARADDAVNDEWICDKGRFAYAYTQSPQRVTEPLVRKEGEFVAVSWPEALDLIATKVREARDAGKSAAVLGGQQLLAEDAYALSRFARTVLGTNDVDARSRAGSAEEDEVLAAIARSGTATNADIDHAKVVVVAGIDLEQESPIVYLRARKAWRRNGARIVEIGPRRTALRTCGASWVGCVPGAEAEVLGDLLSGASVEGLEPVASMLRDAGADVVVLVGDRLAESPGALSRAWNLAQSLGARFGWIPRKAGARAALDAGLHPAMLPGGRSLADAATRAQVEEVWGAQIPATPGRDARAILDEAASLGMLWLAGSDPARDFADASLGGRALDAAAFVVAQDLFLTDSAMRADVVLPAAAVYERPGTIVNWEGRAQQVGAAMPPAGLALADFEILAGVAMALGVSFPYGVDALRKEIVQLVTAPGEPRSVALADAPAGPADRPYRLASYPLLLDGGTMMIGADPLSLTASEPFVEVAAADAQRLGIADGDTVRVASATGSIQAPARVSTSIAPGSVFVPARQGGVDARALLDAGARVTTVAIEKAGR